MVDDDEANPVAAGLPRKLEGVKADTVATQAVNVARRNFMIHNDEKKKMQQQKVCDGSFFLRPPHKLKLKSKELLFETSILRHS